MQGQSLDHLHNIEEEIDHELQEIAQNGHMTHRQLQKCKNELMDQAQKTIDKKKYLMRENKIQKLRTYADPKFEYHEKVNFIESSIEKDILYYGHPNCFL